ncbi:MAG: hypothetical protein AAGD92_01850 [Pseudomonadota bacterium]
MTAPTSHHSGQQGFALPFALMAIAAMAIITAISFRAISGAASVMTELEADIDADAAFISAEAETVFTFLSSSPDLGGLNLAPTSPNTEGAQPQSAASAPNAALLWRGDGEVRLSDQPGRSVYVQYRDGSGLISLPSLKEDALIAFLQLGGLSRSSAEAWAPRIQDYQDQDTTRRPGGAERAEYRLFGAATPADSPLRHYEELSLVLGAGDANSAEFWRYLARNARFGGDTAIFKPAFANDAVAAQFSTIFGDNDIFEGVQDDGRATATARFLLETATENGLTHQRAVEIIRTATAVDKPYRRTWIYDNVDVNPETADRSGRARSPIVGSAEPGALAPVFQPGAPLD